MGIDAEDPAFPTEESKSAEAAASPYEEEEKTEENSISVSTKAKEAGQSFKDLILSVGKKTKNMTAEKSQQVREVSAEKDRQDIQTLGEIAERLTVVFENTIKEIETEYDFEEQEILLSGYKKLLEEQAN